MRRRRESGNSSPIGLMCIGYGVVRKRFQNWDRRPQHVPKREFCFGMSARGKLFRFNQSAPRREIPEAEEKFVNGTFDPLSECNDYVNRTTRVTSKCLRCKCFLRSTHSIQHFQARHRIVAEECMRRISAEIFPRCAFRFTLREIQNGAGVNRLPALKSPTREEAW